MEKKALIYGYEISYKLENGLIKLNFASLSHLPRKEKYILVEKIFAYVLYEGLLGAWAEELTEK